MSFSVTVLGTSGMFATTERACAGYLVQVAGKNVWLDAGAGTWRHLLTHIAYEEIDAVILTHRHPDHTSDIFIADHAFQYGGPEPLPAVPLWAPAEALEYVQAFAPDIEASFTLTAVHAGEAVDIEGAKVSFVEMAHPPETVGVRIEHEGGVFAYSADTGAEADFHALAGGADVFVCEATLQDADEVWEGHLRGSQAARIFQDLASKRLVLTHLPPGRDHGLSLQQALDVDPGAPVSLATDGDRLAVGA